MEQDNRTILQKFEEVILNSPTAHNAYRHAKAIYALEQTMYMMVIVAQYEENKALRKTLERVVAMNPVIVQMPSHCQVRFPLNLVEAPAVQTDDATGTPGQSHPIRPTEF